MRAALLAVVCASDAGAALAQTARPHEVAPLTVMPPPPKDAPPADVTIPIRGDQEAQGVVVFPETALKDGVSGYVTLGCRVDVHGLAERCRVVYESPRGRGFGKAALALRPTFKLTPRAGPDGPVDAPMNVALAFIARPPDNSLQEVNSAAMGSMETTGRTIYVHNNPMIGRAMTMLTEPAWAAAPGFDDWAKAYPPEGGGVEGYAVAHCKVDRQGELSRCAAAEELPAGHGFGRAAVGLAAHFRASPEAMAAAPHGAPVEVDVPVRFVPPGQASDRTVRAPLWIAGSDPATLIRELPPGLAKRADSPGAVVQCKVGQGGAVAGCAIEYTSPDGIDYDEAAVKLASRLRINLWSAEASPVLGGVIHIPVKPAPAERQAER